jgi:hypothetical protein
MSTIFVSLFLVVVGVLGLLGPLDRLGDLPDAAQSGIPRRADGGELGDGAGELGVVDPIPLLAPDDRGMDESGAVEDVEVLGDGLSRDREVFAQTRGRASAVAEQPIEQATPRRIAEGRPQVVVDDDHHGAGA